MLKQFVFLSINTFWFCQIQSANAQHDSALFEVVTSTEKASIIYDKNGSPLDSITAHLLASDIERVSGYLPNVVTALNSASKNAIVIGNRQSGVVESFLGKTEAANSWETYAIQVLEKPTSKIDKALVIAGSDARGTAYGVFSISEKIGVSPWYWWADVQPKKQEQLVLTIKSTQSKSPKVKYRGIFINDEDWGLQPWAENTFEPETGDIGPKTYAKVFELLLRLRANSIWPAMHPSTKAFFHYPGNRKMAEKYEIVLGSSHAEPMLRNNVDEWDHDTMGDFNYFSNKKGVLDYWEDRVDEAKNVNGIYTLGMRGVHDSGMEGAKTTAGAATMLKDILKDQRALIEKHIGNPESVPQVFTVYKEVLDLYDYGLDLPDDVTLMWTDDNYGYIRRLSNAEERKRSGGSGVYYHASYWGRPHDYLWLSTTHPALIREEMLKAYDTGADKIWILNVGDIKPAEYNMQFFMDLAFDPESLRQPASYKDHMLNFYQEIFGDTQGEQISELRNEYYNLAWTRKPEFMGWSQTEPTRPTQVTEFSIEEENPSRIAAYQNLTTQVEKLSPTISEANQDAFFQLVSYPILGAAAMNKQYLYRDLQVYHHTTNEKESEKYRDSVSFYYEKINELTDHYNQKIASGKWNSIMHRAPRGLPVFKLPDTAIETTNQTVETPKVEIYKAAADYDNASKFEKAFPQKLTGLGYTQNALQIASATATSKVDSNFKNNASLSYKFSLEKAIQSPVITITAVPNHPITEEQQLKLGVQLDDGDVKIVDFKTTGRSEEWKLNILRNQARKSVDLQELSAGTHSLKFYVIDPGVILDYFVITQSGTTIPYTLPKN